MGRSPVPPGIRAFRLNDELAVWFWRTPVVGHPTGFGVAETDQPALVAAD